MLKKFISVLAVIAMALSICTGAVCAANPTIKIGTVSGHVGETVEVTVTIENNPGIWGMDLVIGYDKTGLTLKSVENGVIFADSEVTEGNFEADKYILSCQREDLTDTTKSGVLATLVFEIKIDAETQDYEIKGTFDAEHVIIDSNIKDVDFDIINGKISASKNSFRGLSFDGAEYVYDGTAKELSVKGAPADATVTYTSGDFDSDGKAINAGTYSVTATVKKAGYNDWTETKTLTITPKDLKITGLSAKDKTYDGTDKAELNGGTLSGAISGDDVTANIPTEGKFNDKNVGSGKAVTIDTIVLSGAKKDNYTLEQPTGLKANIAAKEISVTVDDKQMIKGGTMPAFTYKATLCAAATASPASFQQKPTERKSVILQLRKAI